MLIDCSVCGRSFKKRPSKIKAHNFCTKECFGKWHNLFDVRCEHCGNESHPRNHRERFCGVQCFNESRINRLALKCDNCGIEFTRQVSQYKVAKNRNSSHFFCDRKCANMFRRGSNHPKWIEDRSLLKNNNKSVRESLEMKEWRRAVFLRDDWQCRLCQDRSSVGHRVTLNAHHIKRLVDYPELGFEIDNGITLCEPCHKLTYQKEEQFEEQFQGILALKAK